MMVKEISSAEALVVGDTPLDIDAAHGAEAVAVGVATGHYSERELSEAGADYVLPTLEQELPLGEAVPS
jgi:phosphoglycolate phosphatase-like HAD superfamily hydrolase